MLQGTLGLTKGVRPRYTGTVVPCLAAIVMVAVLLIPSWMKNRAVVESTPGDRKAKLVSIKARNVDIAQILHSFADQIEARLLLDRNIRGKISIEAQNSDFTEVMDNLCTAFNCQWKLSQGSGLSLVVRPRISEPVGKLKNGPLDPD